MNLGWKLWLRIAAVILLLYTFYSTGLSLEYIIVLGIIFIVIIFLRGPLYKKIEEILTRHLKFMSSVKPWVKRLIVILVFIVIYIILRELIYVILGLFGIDVQHALTQGFNESAMNLSS